MDSLNALFDELIESGKLIPLEGATEEEISDFEKKYGVSLPPQYREWLLLTDGGDLCQPAGIQLYGVAHSPLINPNDSSRPNSRYLVVGALCTGDPILLEEQKGNVAIYNLEARLIEEEESYGSLIDFLGDLGGILGLEE